MDEVGRSSALPAATHPARWDRSGAPVYGYSRSPEAPPVGVVRSHDPDSGIQRHRHAHDFLVVCLVERGSGMVRADGRDLPLSAGDLVVLGPGRLIEPGALGGGAIEAWSVYFPAEAITATAPDTFLSWQAHPMLFPFVGGPAGGVQRLHVPVADRPALLARFAALEQELLLQREGYRVAALAHLTLLLLDVARCAADVPGSLSLRGDPLLAAVFDVIESNFALPLSLADVAAAVGLSAGHLTTVVGRRTGRTVQDWINERRMAEARRLLAGTDLAVVAVAGRVGFRDAGYFTRRFRRSHGMPPMSWRRAHAEADAR